MSIPAMVESDVKVGSLFFENILLETTSTLCVIFRAVDKQVLAVSKFPVVTAFPLPARCTSIIQTKIDRPHRRT